MELILSASLSGISNPNSSSRAITISTVSKLSRPRSFWKWAFGVTYNIGKPKCQSVTLHQLIVLREQPSYRFS
ncbi:unnamed protein product [Linum trigynum]|uniref:Uncharacterized protein n=1 Tax=Linum trigynum TaxID=586398 RepID=A0AAV2EHX4_9ROSI